MIRAARRAVRSSLPWALGALAFLAKPAHAGDEAEVRWLGPLHLRSQFPLDLPTLDLEPDDASLLGRGRTSIEVLVVHENTFEVSGKYEARAADFEAGIYHSGWDFLMDAESTRGTIRADFGVSRHVQLGIEAAFVDYSGGFMDSAISHFHGSLGLPDNDRDTQPRDLVDLDVISGSRRLTMAHSETGLSDLALRGKFLLFDGARTALSALAEVKAPTASDSTFLGSGEWDYGAGLLLSTGGERHVFHAGLAHYFLGQPPAYPVEVRDRTSAFAGYELRATERWSVAVQAMAATSILPADRSQQNDGPRAELQLGAIHARGPWRLSFGVIENLTTNDNTADLGVFVGSRWLF